MNGRSFLDTNILVYTDDADSPEKQRRAIDLYAECRRGRRGVLSTQVLQEYFVTVTCKLGVDASIARRKTELFGAMDTVKPGGRPAAALRKDGGLAPCQDPHPNGMACQSPTGC